MLEEIEKMFFCFWDSWIWIGFFKFTLLSRECLWPTLNVLTNSPKILHITKRDFPSQLATQWSINMVKVVSFRFQQCLVPLTKLLLEGTSERGLLRHLYNHVFRKYISYDSHIFWKMFKISSRFQNCQKKFKKNFFFWDNCIWIGCLKLSLLRRENLSWAVNMLTNIDKTLHITKRDFLQLNYLQSEQ